MGKALTPDPSPSGRGEKTGKRRSVIRYRALVLLAHPDLRHLFVQPGELCPAEFDAIFHDPDRLERNIERGWVQVVRETTPLYRALKLFRHPANPLIEAKRGQLCPPEFDAVFEDAAVRDEYVKKGLVEVVTVEELTSPPAPLQLERGEDKTVDRPSEE